MLIRFFMIFLLLSLFQPLKGLAAPPLAVHIQRMKLINDHIQFEKIIKDLHLQEGMTILDIGAGLGHHSFIFAGALQGTGKVFATDVREDFVAYIAEQARSRNLTNLFPVLVTPDGLDDFYTRNEYDIVLISNTYHLLDNRISYFKELRRFLKPDARLILLMYDQVPIFTEAEFSDFNGVIDILSSADEDDIFVRHLSADTRRLLTNKEQGNETKRAVIKNFNMMMTNPIFYKGFIRHPYVGRNMLSKSERNFINWLLMTIQENGTFDKSADQIEPREMRPIMKLNRLLIASRFGDYLSNDGTGSYMPVADSNQYVSKYVMFRELDKAGYQLAREIRMSPYFEALIMIPNESY